MRIYGIRLYVKNDPQPIVFFERSTLTLNDTVETINEETGARFEPLNEHALDTLKTIDARGGYRLYDERNISDNTTYLRVLPFDLDL